MQNLEGKIAIFRSVRICAVFLKEVANFPPEGQLFSRSGRKILLVCVCLSVTLKSALFENFRLSSPFDDWCIYQGSKASL